MDVRHGLLHTIERERSIKTNFRWVETVNEDKRRYMQFFVTGADYKILGFIPGNIHLFGIDDGFIHLFGTDASGKDIFRAPSTPSGRHCRLAVSGYSSPLFWRSS